MKPVSRGPRLAASLLVTAAAAVACADPTYAVVAAIRVDDLRTTGLAVNATGQLAGFHVYTSTSASSSKGPAPQGSLAFVTAANGGTATDVDPLAGTGAIASGPCKGLLLSDAFTAINAGGAAAGTSAVAVTSTSSTKTTYAVHATLYSGGTLTDLGTLGGTNSAAFGINASGLVVGASDLGKGKTHAFSSNGTTMTDLGTLGGDLSVATAVNDTGTIVGTSALSKKATHLFSYASGAMTDLGLPTNFTNATATAISSAGAIVGFGSVPATSSSGSSSGKHGPPPMPLTQSFVYSGSAYTILPSLYKDKKGNATPVRAEGVNASGVVVGSTVNASGKPTAFVYEGGTMTDLSTILPTGYTGYTVVDATGISDTGYIAATAVDSTGKQYALLLQLS